jgi:hypothetical protein
MLTGGIWIGDFLHSTPFMDLLPPNSMFFAHPLTFMGRYIEVYQMHSEHVTAQTAEMRRQKVEDVKRRSEYRKAHGLEDENESRFGGWTAKSDDEVLGPTPAMREGGQLPAEVESSIAMLSQQRPRCLLQRMSPMSTLTSRGRHSRRRRSGLAFGEREPSKFWHSTDYNHWALACAPYFTLQSTGRGLTPNHCSDHVQKVHDDTRAVGSQSNVLENPHLRTERWADFTEPSRLLCECLFDWTYGRDTRTQHSANDHGEAQIIDLYW